MTKKFSSILGDKELRPFLREWLTSRESSFLEEYCISSGATRLDFICYNNHLGVFSIELKSDKDNYKRLEKQTYLSSIYFNKVFVACTESGCEKIQDYIEDFIGILSINKNGTITVVRDAKDSPNFDQLAMLSQIRKRTLNKILKFFGMRNIQELNRKLTYHDVNFVFHHFIKKNI